MIGGLTRDKIVALAAVAAGALTTVAVAHGWISRSDGEQIGLVIASAVTAYHVNNDSKQSN